MTDKAVVNFGVGQDAKNEHSRSYVSFFATQRYSERYPELSVGLGLTRH